MATETTSRATVRYRVTGMDCPDCVAKLEKALRNVAGHAEARVSLTARTMTLRLSDDGASLPDVERVVTGLGYQLDRLDAPGADTRVDELPADLSPIPAPPALTGGRFGSSSCLTWGTV